MMKFIMLGALVCLYTFDVTAKAKTPDPVAVWETKVQWNDKTEEDYASWVKKNASSDFFSSPDKDLQGAISVDCARAAFAMRMVFARNKGLRFYVKGNSGVVYDSESFLPRSTTLAQLTDANKLWLTFAKEAIMDVSTIAVKNNSFPIAITKETFKPGVIYLFQKAADGVASDRHAYIVRDVTEAGIPHFVWATVPMKPRVLSERLDFPHYMPLDPTWENEWGFRRFYQPKDYALREELEALKSEISKLKAKSKKTDEENAKLSELEKALKEKPTKMFGGRGYSDFDQQNIALAAVKNFEKDYIAEIEKQNVDKRYIDFSDFKFETALKSRTNDERKILPALPKSINGNFLADSKEKNATVSLLKKYHNILAVRLKRSLPERPQDYYLREFQNLCFQIRERKAAVEEGYDYFFRSARIVSAPNVASRCTLGTEQYDYSTPTRDMDMTLFFAGLRQTYLREREKMRKDLTSWFYIYEVIFVDKPDMRRIVNNADEKITPERNQELVDWAKNKILTMPLSEFSEKEKRDTCSFKVDYKNGKSEEILYPWEVRKRFEQPGLLSPQPWVSIERRWGKRAPGAGELKLEANLVCHTKKVEEGEKAKID